jgi:hypothetical protein
MMPLSIFIAGPSSERERSAEVMRRVRAMGHTVAVDWLAMIGTGEANPTNAPAGAMQPQIDELLDGLKDADVLVVLTPSEGHSTKGAYGELLGFLALSKFFWMRTRPIVLVGDAGIYGLDEEVTRVESDEAALRWLMAMKVAA